MGRTALVCMVALALGGVVATDADDGETTTTSAPTTTAAEFFSGEGNVLAMETITETEAQNHLLNIIHNPVVTEGTNVTDANEAPYIVRLLLCGTDALCYTCGGTWISQTDILTAAHCLPDNPGTLYFYRNDIDGLENERHSSVSGSTANYVIHSNWDGKTGNGYDIAILKTVNTQQVTPMALAEPTDFDNLQQNVDTLVAYGFGETTDGGDVAEVLMKSEELGWLNCQIMQQVGYYVQADERSYRFPTDKPGLFCFEPNDGSDMCKGDSGGPLVKDGIQYGINSFVYGACGQYPSVDTSVAFFLDWIIDNSDYNITTEPIIVTEEVQGPCGDAGCSHYCSESGDVAICTCPIDLTIDIHNTTNCVDVTTNVMWANTIIRDDHTIRPFSNSEECFYHKKNGYTTDEAAGKYELIYMGQCSNHNRYRWFFESDGLIMSQNRYTTTPHCITIPEPDKVNKKQQVYLGPCDPTRIDQVWKVEGGHIKLVADDRTCIRWNLGSLTRLWTLPCDDMTFTDFEQV